MYRIPLTQTTLGPEESAAAERVIVADWLTMGPEVAAFEEEFAAAVGALHAVAVANGTAALEIIYQAAGIGPGDEVIMPAITFAASMNAAVRLGARPVLADLASENDLTLSPQSAETLVTERTRAIVTMPFGGFPPAMQEFEALAKDHGIFLIEDACHAPLAELNGRKIGTFGLAAAWSFYGNKNLTTGEGGMITTDDPALANKARALRSHGMTRLTWERAAGSGFSYDIEETGMNARMDEIRAAIGREQLRKLPDATEARARAALWLRCALEEQEIAGLQIPFENYRGRSAHHVFVVLLPPDVCRQGVMEFFRNHGIQTSIHYPPLDRFAVWKEDLQELPVTRAVESRLLTLPLGPKSTREECGEVAQTLAAAVKKS